MSAISVAIVFITIFYSFSSNLKRKYLDLKNKFSDTNQYLAVLMMILWIKEEIEVSYL